MNAFNRSTDEALGAAWWTCLTECQRALWLLRAGSDAPADAWEVFKAGLPHTPNFPNRRPAAHESDQAAHHDQQ
jgi:hypothetical protein